MPRTGRFTRRAAAAARTVRRDPKPAPPGLACPPAARMDRPPAPSATPLPFWAQASRVADLRAGFSAGPPRIRPHTAAGPRRIAAPAGDYPHGAHAGGLPPAPRPDASLRRAAADQPEGPRPRKNDRRSTLAKSARTQTTAVATAMEKIAAPTARLRDMAYPHCCRPCPVIGALPGMRCRRHG